MLQFKEFLKKDGFKASIKDENLLQKDLRNGWFVGVAIDNAWNSGKGIIVDAVHITQSVARDCHGGLRCYEYGETSNHLWCKINGITANKKYVRNIEGLSFKSPYMAKMAVELLKFRLK